MGHQNKSEKISKKVGHSWKDSKVIVLRPVGSSARWKWVPWKTARDSTMQTKSCRKRKEQHHQDSHQTRRQRQAKSESEHQHTAKPPDPSGQTQHFPFQSKLLEATPVPRCSQSHCWWVSANCLVSCIKSVLKLCILSLMTWQMRRESTWNCLRVHQTDPNKHCDHCDLKIKKTHQTLSQSLSKLSEMQGYSSSGAFHCICASSSLRFSIRWTEASESPACNGTCWPVPGWIDIYFDCTIHWSIIPGGWKCQN